MLQLEVRSIINSLVRQELEGKSGNEHRALYFNLDLEMYDLEKSRRRRGLHLLYHSLMGTSVTVFSGITESSFASIQEIQPWIFEISHDSCWRNAEVFQVLYFGLVSELNQHRKSLQKKTLAPVEFCQHTTFRHPVFQWMPVKVSKDPTDSDNYRKIIQLL